MGLVKTLMDVMSLCLARYLISRVDNSIQLLDQFVDLKFRTERQVEPENWHEVLRVLL